MKENPRIGFFARVDDGGLAVESQEFIEHLHPKVMKIAVGDLPQDPDRFEGALSEGIPSDHAVEEFLKDVDVLFSIETTYNRYAFSIAKRMGVKTILRVNYEYLDALCGMMVPDLYVAPSPWHFRDIPDPKVMLPFPVNTEKIKAREIRKAKTFVHVAGHGGAYSRNGTDLVIRALPHIKSDARFIIYSQLPIAPIDDPRVELRIGSVKNYWEMYGEGDVFLYPRRHSGQSLTLNEAQAAGMAIMMTDMGPQNEFLPKEMLIPVQDVNHVDLKRRIELARVAPEDVAAKVDEFYNQDIWQFSKKSAERAKAISWETLLPEYRKMFSSV